MPFALIAAVLASLGAHAVVLFVPEFELSPPPEPVLLQAEIVLKPRAIPEARPAVPPPAKKTVVPRAKPAERPLLPEVAAEVPAAAATTMPETLPAAAAKIDTAEPAELQLPAQGEIVFTVLRGDPPAIIGRAVQSWELGDGTYRIVSVMETVGLAALLRPLRLETESRGRIVANGLEPATYTSLRQDKGKEKSERVEFDWAAAVVRFSNGTTSPLPPGSQDLLSFNFQLGWLSKTGDMSIATAKKLGSYRLELIGEEYLETQVGYLRTLHFRAPGETTTEVWLAPAHHLLPVKIRHIDKKGESYDQLAEEIRIPN
ncbi:MAG: DUF3108 domain-containing protein [Rhodocyclaceae bacterium]